MKKFPAIRPRRSRFHEWSRRLVAENTLSVDDLILPLFLVDGKKRVESVDAMPGVFRYSVDEILKVVEKVSQKKIPLIALFPKIDIKLKTNDGKEALNPEGLIPEAIVKIKKEFPNIGIMTDVALDPYTTHGQDGLISEDGTVKNDETIDILKQQSLLYAEMGADIVAPSDMMDGRIGVIRNALENNNHCITKIMAYSAKYSSSFYNPFRDAVGSSKNLGDFDKKNYQMDPANSLEALTEVELDIFEGADMVMIKPGLPYLDIVYITKHTFKMPTFAYQVSGEYSMIKAASLNQYLDEKNVVLETLLSFKRAGCSGILTYYAINAAEWLEEI